MMATGMNICLHGVLEKSAKLLDRFDETGLGFMLRQLNEHLEEFRQRHKAGDEKVADEFFDLYVE